MFFSLILPLSVFLVCLWLALHGSVIALLICVVQICGFTAGFVLERIEQRAPQYSLLERARLEAKRKAQLNRN